MTLAVVLTLAALIGLQHPGAAGMNFDQEATVHHFTIERAGGTIEVRVKPRTPASTLTAVRTHLRHVATAFAQGDFSDSIATHGEVPPGIPEMVKLKDRITYRFNERPGGGAVTIRTTDSTALEAVHAFLRYQIKAHHTGDKGVQ